jgi:chemosensory pili system protein ChpA (sensor histidine kinase/response regulator)
MTSGRGVGMNAVRRQISDINGILELYTEPGKGTTFRIRVPSSLAITNIVVFSYGAIEFVMSTSLIEEVVEYQGPMELPEGAAEPDGRELIDYRGTPVAVKRLSELFQVAGNGHQHKKNQFVIVCGLSNKKAGLIVDDIIGQEETIIKPVNRFLEGLSIYSGVTISGDGKVRLVLNPLKVFEEEIKPVMVAPLETESFEGRRILVVDDSLSVRKYLTSFLEGRKFKVHAASNGGEALKMLEDEAVDLVITDLEMPLMHGYDLVARIRVTEAVKNIPIIVLTSRSNEKHREKAFEIGANDYLVKPFDERALLASLKKFLFMPAEFA